MKRSSATVSLPFRDSPGWLKTNKASAPICSPITRASARSPPLDGDFKQYPEADCLYLHDLAVSRRAAGRGIGPALVSRNLEQASRQQIRYSALVSVQESEAFWSRLGYSAHTELEPRQVDNLASYRLPAVYMVRALH